MRAPKPIRFIVRIASQVFGWVREEVEAAAAWALVIGAGLSLLIAFIVVTPFTWLRNTWDNS